MQIGLTLHSKSTANKLPSISIGLTYISFESLIPIQTSTLVASYIPSPHTFPGYD